MVHAIRLDHLAWDISPSLKIAMREADVHFSDGLTPGVLTEEEYVRYASFYHAELSTSSIHEDWKHLVSISERSFSWSRFIGASAVDVCGVLATFAADTTTANRLLFAIIFSVAAVSGEETIFERENPLEIRFRDRWLGRSISFLGHFGAIGGSALTLLSFSSPWAIPLAVLSITVGREAVQMGLREATLVALRMCDIFEETLVSFNSAFRNSFADFSPDRGY